MEVKKFLKRRKRMLKRSRKNAEGKMTPRGHCIYLLTDISGFKQTEFITYLTFLHLSILVNVLKYSF